MDMSAGSSSYSTSMRAQGFLGRLLVHGRDGGHGVADEAHLVHRERVLVLADGKDAERDRQLGADQRGGHSRVRGGLATSTDRMRA